MWHRIIEVLPILIALATGCATAHAPPLTALQAIKLATAETARQHVDLQDYKQPYARYNDEDASWFVYWDQWPDNAGTVHIGGDYTARVNASGESHSCQACECTI
jgi:hypothetical protein